MPNYQPLLLSLVLAAAGLTVGCASKTIAFSANEKATLSLVSFEDAGGQGTVVGDLPQTVEVDDMDGKMAKVWGKGVVPQYWVLREVLGNETKVVLRLEKTKNADDDEAEKKPQNGEPEKNAGDKTVSSNLPYRLLMRAYTALANRQWKVARELAAEMNKIEGKIAAPHVITGIAYLQEGTKTDARAAFERAKAIDPEDKEIDKLMKLVQ